MRPIVSVLPLSRRLDADWYFDVFGRTSASSGSALPLGDELLGSHRRSGPLIAGISWDEARRRMLRICAGWLVDWVDPSRQPPLFACEHPQCRNSTSAWHLTTEASCDHTYGPELCLAIKKLTPTAVAIMISGMEEEFERIAREAVRKTAYTIVHKPLDIDHLLAPAAGSYGTVRACPPRAALRRGSAGPIFYPGRRQHRTQAGRRGESGGRDRRPARRAGGRQRDDSPL